MSELLPIPEPVTTADVGDSPVARKRPKPGERRMQILQTLAEMLEQPGPSASPRRRWPRACR